MPYFIYRYWELLFLLLLCLCNRSIFFIAFTLKPEALKSNIHGNIRGGVNLILLNRGVVEEELLILLDENVFDYKE